MQHAQTGFFKRVWVALVGEADPVKAQLKEMSKQGAGMARAGNMFAYLLVILFSLVSLATLAGDDFRTFVASVQAGHVNILAGVFTSIIPAMVLAMDFGMLYAASVIRRLKSRHSGMDEKLMHYSVIWGVVFLEASTYIYGAYLYDHPNSIPSWGLIVVRAIGAPLFSVYLSMAKPLPIAPRDVLHQAELILGVAILRKVTAVANNTSAELPELMAMYRTVSIASPEDHARLSSLIDVASKSDILALPEVKVIPPKVPPTNGGQHVDISPIADEVDEEDTNGYTQPDLRIARFTPSKASRNHHRDEGVRRHRNYDEMATEAYTLLDSYGLDDRARPAISLEELQGQLHVKRKYAEDFRNQWWRDQIASMQGQDMSSPNLVDGEMTESGLWVAK